MVGTQRDDCASRPARLPAVSLQGMVCDALAGEQLSLTIEKIEGRGRRPSDCNNVSGLLAYQHIGSGFVDRDDKVVTRHAAAGHLGPGRAVPEHDG